jgi:VanZ family protein
MLFDITKVAHFLLFAILGGLLYVRQGRGSVWRVVVDTGMFACGTELVQLFVDGRSALVGDVVLDMGGVGLCRVRSAR